ncbi:SdiA-regulated domain-containing protein [Pseudomonas sp.]|uniref:SdiA-regulated domain-containing protein n=1 Tax=Pseudomonas sp. TaxID=306 RepID=UPI004053AE4E
MSIWIARLVRLRWLILLLFVLVIGLLVMNYRHWDDRLSFWAEEQQVTAVEQQQSIWLPGYRAVLQGKPLQGLEDDELSGLTYGVLQGSCRVSRFFMQPFSVPVAPSRGSV